MNRKGFSLFVVLSLLLHPTIVGGGPASVKGARVRAAMGNVSKSQKRASSVVDDESKNYCKKEGHKGKHEPTALEKLFCMLFIVGFLLWHLTPRKGASSSFDSGCKDNSKGAQKNASECKQEAGEVAVVPQ